MGTIAEKLSYLNNTKQLLKDKINDLGGNIDSETTFREYVSNLTEIYNDYPKVSDTGTEINLTNTKQGKLTSELNPSETSQDGNPTPENPFPIHTVSGENNIKIENKNLFDYDKATQVVNNVNFVINEDKSIIANGTASSNTYWKLGELYLPRDGTYYISGAPNDASSSTYRVTCYLHDENGTYLSAYSDTGTGISFSGNKGYRLDYYIYIANGVTVTNKVFKPMVKQGSTPSEYVPHQEQNYVINLGDLKYCEIVDYKDQIFKNIINSPYYDSTLNENEWYMKKNIGKVVLDGSETGWTDRPNYNGADRFIIDNFFPTNDKNILSNYFTKVTTVTDTYPYIIDNGTQLLINFSAKGTTTLAQFKTWLSTHNTEVVYVLNTPQYINITENYPTLATQLETLNNNAKTYDDETNISQTNNDLPFDLDIKALMKGV